MEKLRAMKTKETRNFIDRAKTKKRADYQVGALVEAMAGLMAGAWEVETVEEEGEVSRTCSVIPGHVATRKKQNAMYRSN